MAVETCGCRTLKAPERNVRELFFKNEIQFYDLLSELRFKAGGGD